MTRWLLIGEPDWAPLSAWAEGLRSIGLKPSWTPINDWARQECDVAVCYGLRYHGRDVLDYYARRGVPVVVLDHGYVRRVFTERDLKTAYLQVGVNRLGWVPDRAPSADRWEALGVELAPRPPRPIKRALIMGQVPMDASHRMSVDQLERCYEHLAEELIRAGARRVAFRPHPLSLPPTKPKIEFDDQLKSIDEAIAGADLVVSLNSNAGLDAVMAGCPAVTLKPSHYGELAYRWPVRLAAMRPPSLEALRGFCERLAYAQWTDAEIREGLPHKFLQSLGAIP